MPEYRLDYCRRRRANPAGLASEADMSEFVRCGSCGYSLVGLREVRCPECGWQSTIDEAVRRGMAEFIELRGTAVTSYSAPS